MFEDAIEKLNRETESMAGLPKFQCEKRTYTVEDIQNILNVSRTSAYRLIKSNQFHVLKIGTTVRVPVKAFDAWFEGGCEDDADEQNNDVSQDSERTPWLGENRIVLADKERVL